MRRAREPRGMPLRKLRAQRRGGCDSDDWRRLPSEDGIKAAADDDGDGGAAAQASRAARSFSRVFFFLPRTDQITCSMCGCFILHQQTPISIDS